MADKFPGLIQGKTGGRNGAAGETGNGVAIQFQPELFLFYKIQVPLKMKEKIHPKYVDCEITCLCGNVIHTRSTRDKLNVEICSNCHPFFTGQQKIVDTAGRVERFRKRYEKSTYGKK